jgi:hypothetical protein
MIKWHMATCLAIVCAALVCIASATAGAESVFSVQLEGAAVFSGYNDVRIPGSTGTLVSLVDDLETESSFAFRVRLTYWIGERHLLSFLAAPLELDASGSTREPVDFAGETFDAETPLDALYRFNSYRLTYRYQLYEAERLLFGIGVTGKIRDAAIAISGGGKSAEKTNTGFVPLLNFSLEWRMHPKFSLLFEGDALAAPQGRAEDVLLAFSYDIKSDFGLRAGYRILEGGADNDEVYNFALIHYIVLGVDVSF